jgi:hypothetical protein
MNSTGSTGEPLLDQAWMYFHDGDYQRAIQLLRQAIHGGVNPGLAEYRLGFCFRAMGKHDDAIAHFRQAARIDPDSAWACFQVGKELALQGRLENALSELARAIELDLTHADAYHDAGACLGSLGHFEEALKCFTVCAFACEVVVAQNIYTSVTPEMLRKATNQLAGLMGQEKFHQTRARVWQVFGMPAYPQTADHISHSGFETMRAELTQVMRKYGSP